ncbi:MAG TPA: Ku protein [Polyangiaceae bacterium]|nr:Ku protein [Polyangiaceae bacterium]
MARAIWSGSINFGLVTIPIKLYTAVHEHTLHFNYLHKRDGGRIHYERVCSVCGEKVDWSDVVRGYELERGEYVVLEDEDFKKASPEASQAVDIVEFVDATQIEPIFFDVPYYVEPERKGRHAYLLLREALSESHKVGIARMVMRTREHLAALKPVGEALVVETMHWPDEVGDARGLELPERGKPPAAEMKMARMLIDAMTAKFEPDELKDRYRDQLLALIEARARGRPAPAGKGAPRSPTNVVDLMKVLEKSIAETQGQKTRSEDRGDKKKTGDKPKKSRAGRRGKRAA